MRYNEKKGHWPLMKVKQADSADAQEVLPSDSEVNSIKEGLVNHEKRRSSTEGIPTEVRSVDT